MELNASEIEVNGVKYVPKDSASGTVVSNDGMRYVIVRTYSAGVFAGFLKSKKGQNVTLLEARRLWYWSGAASLSQLANEGVKKPADCKFPKAVSQIDLTQAIEILNVTSAGKKSIEGVPEWKV